MIIKQPLTNISTRIRKKNIFSRMKWQHVWPGIFLQMLVAGLTHLKENIICPDAHASG